MKTKILLDYLYPFFHLLTMRMIINLLSPYIFTFINIRRRIIWQATGYKRFSYLITLLNINNFVVMKEKNSKTKYPFPSRGDALTLFHSFLFQIHLKAD
jgi:hypothetical protein